MWTQVFSKAIPVSVQVEPLGPETRGGWLVPPATCPPRQPLSCPPDLSLHPPRSGFFLCSSLLYSLSAALSHKRQLEWNFRWHREMNLFFYIVFSLHWVLVASWAFSSCGEWGFSSLQYMAFSRQWLLLWITGSGHEGFVVVVCGISSCSSHVLEHKVQLPHGTRDPPRLQGSNPCPCIGRRILNWTTRKVPREIQVNISLMNSFSFNYGI